jgi:hypothetical protein
MPEIMEPTATPSAVGFPEVLKVIEGVVVVDTEDRGLAAVAYNGFVYRLSLEFARQQPGLVLLYDIEVELLGIEEGSIRQLFRAVFRLKQRVAEEVKKAGAVATLGLILAIPPGIIESEHLFEQLFPPVRAQLQTEMPSCQINIEVATIQAPDDSSLSDRPPRTRHDEGRTRHRRRPPLRGGSFDL